MRATVIHVLAPMGLVGLTLAGPASATEIVFEYSGTVASLIDTDNVYGFGAGADLAGKSVTDTYIVDTTGPGSTFSSGTFGVGGSNQSWTANLPSGASAATSTIGGHTINLNLNVFNYAQRIVSPPGPFDQTLIESQAIGFETSGNAIGTEFLIRDEAVTYSLAIPLSLSASYYVDNSVVTENGQVSGLIYQTVFLPYDGAPGGLFNITSISVNGGVPEPPTWSILLVGCAGLGFAGYRRSVKAAAVT